MCQLMRLLASKFHREQTLAVWVGQPGSLPLLQPRDGPVENAGQFSTQLGRQVLVDFLFLESARTGGSQGGILTVMLSDGGKPLSAVS